MNQKSKSRWLLDAALFAGLILACFVGLTGLALHQWIGVAAGVAALYHLFAHMDWMEAAAGRLFSKSSGRARLLFLVDSTLLLGFTAMVGTGLVMSTWLGLDLSNYALWRGAHIAATIASLLVTALKIFLHRRWIIQVARKWIFYTPNPPTFERVLAGSDLARVPAPAAVTRREFLGLIGIVGSATLLALGQSVRSLDETQAEKTTTVAESEIVASYTASSINTSTTTCQVLCNRRCSFPGHCRRYTDANSNNRCDLGECV